MRPGRVLSAIHTALSGFLRVFSPLRPTEAYSQSRKMLFLIRPRNRSIFYYRLRLSSVRVPLLLVRARSPTLTWQYRDHPTYGTPATLCSGTNDEDRIPGVTWAPCSKPPRCDSPISHPDPEAASAIARLDLVASARWPSHVGWTPTYSAGTASSRQHISSRYRRRQTHLSKIQLVGSGRAQTTERT